MQDQQHLGYQSAITPLSGDESSNNEYVNQTMENNPVTGIDQHHSVKEGEATLYDINEKEKNYSADHNEEIGDEDVDENNSEDHQPVVEMEGSEEEIEKHTREESRQIAIAQTAELSKEKSAKAYNSLLLVQEFHTGLTSGDDSGESETEDDQGGEIVEKLEGSDHDAEEEEEDECEASITTSSEAVNAHQSLPLLSSHPRPVDPEFVALKAFRPDYTNEEAIARNKSLSEFGLLFTRDEYKYYNGNAIMNTQADENAAYYDEVQEILTMIAEKERKWEATPVDQRKRKPKNPALDPEAKRVKLESPTAETLLSPLQPYLNSEMPDPSVVMFDFNEASPAAEYDSSPSQSSITAEGTPPPPIVPISAGSSKPKPKPNPQLAVLDTVLSNILRDSQQTQQKAKTNELSDLEAAAMAAGLDLNPNAGKAGDKSGPRSKLSKQEHAEFLKWNGFLKKVVSMEDKIVDLSNKIYFKQGKELSVQERIRFDRLCSLVKSEKEEFLKYQCKSVIESGAYNTLDPKVEKLVREVYELEKKRVYAYPVSLICYLPQSFTYIPECSNFTNTLI